MPRRLTLLTGREAGEILATGVAGSGGRVTRYAARSVHHQPRGRTTVCYEATVDWGGRTSTETLVASAGGPGQGEPTPPGTVVLSDGEDEVRLWRFPWDPQLPGLARAVDPAAAAALLDELEVPGFHGVRGRVFVRLRTYRPGRRAVVQVSAPGSSVYLRVLRPAAAADVHRRHELLHAGGVPVPRPWGCTGDGILVLSDLAGPTLRECLRGTGPIPGPAQVLDLADSLPDSVMELPARRSWADQADSFGAVVADTVPDQRARVLDLAERITSGLTDLPGNSPTHGDLHDAQIIVGPAGVGPAGAGVAGLLDVDTVGPGRAADDIATLLGHLEVQVLFDAPGADRISTFARGIQRAAEQRHDPRELRLRVGGVLLSLATGPYRNQQAQWEVATRLHVDAVERWVAAGAPGRR